MSYRVHKLFALSRSGKESENQAGETRCANFQLERLKVKVKVSVAATIGFYSSRRTTAQYDDSRTTYLYWYCIVFVGVLFSFSTITHEPLHLARRILQEQPGLTAPRNAENFKVIDQSQGHKTGFTDSLPLRDRAKQFVYTIAHEPLHSAFSSVQFGSIKSLCTHRPFDAQLRPP